MPIQYTIDHEARHVEAKFDGQLVLKDIEEFTDAVVGAGALPYRKLIDGRTAHGTYTDADVMALGARLAPMRRWANAVPWRSFRRRQNTWSWRTAS